MHPLISEDAEPNAKFDPYRNSQLITHSPQPAGNAVSPSVSRFATEEFELLRNVKKVPETCGERGLCALAVVMIVRNEKHNGTL